MGFQIYLFFCCLGNLPVLPQWQPLTMQSVSAEGPSHACGSSCKQCVKVWSHSGKKEQTTAVLLLVEWGHCHQEEELMSRTTDQGSGVGLGPFVQQHFGHAVVSAVCSHVQWREVVQRYVVDLGVVLQQLLNAVHVVTLCCHVDRRQAVLQENQNHSC